MNILDQLALMESKLRISSLLKRVSSSGDYVEPPRKMPSVLYHVTNKKNYKAIKQKGLTPRLGSITMAGHGSASSKLVYLLDHLPSGIFNKDSIIITVDPKRNDIWFFTGQELIELGSPSWGETISEGDFPVGIEPGDYYSESKVDPKMFYDSDGVEIK